MVTGGAGFIGSNLVHLLLQNGWSVDVIDNLVAGKKERVPPSARLHVVDVLDMEQIIPLMKGADTVYHLAGLPKVQFSIEEPSAAHAVNLTGVVSVLDAARQAGVRRVVFASSASVYGDHDTLPLHEELSPRPIMPYALQKYVGEKYLRMFSELYDLETVSLRFFNVYGPSMDPNGAYALVVAKWLERKKEGRPLPVTGDGSQTRDFIHVMDIARANILAATSPKVGRGESINIGSGVATSLNDLAALFGGEVEYLPQRIENRHSVADVRRAKELLEWEPDIKLADGIAALLKIESVE